MYWEIHLTQDQVAELIENPEVRPCQSESPYYILIAKG